MKKLKDFLCKLANVESKKVLKLHLAKRMIVAFTKLVSNEITWLQKKPTAFTVEANKMSKIIKNKNKVLKIHKQSIN